MSNIYSILIMTPVGRTEDGNQIDYFPSRWSGSSGVYKVNSFYPYELAYLSSNIKGIYPNERAELICLDDLPLPEDIDIKRMNYTRLYGSEFNEVEVYSTRGCPYMCNFCVAANIYYGRPSFRVRKIESVIEEIKYLINTIPNLEGIFFNEEAHTLNRKYIINLCEQLVKEKLNYLKFNCMTNYDSLDEELLKKMKEAGYYKIRMGIETLDEESTRNITRSGVKSKNNKLLSVLEVCKKIGIRIYSTLSVGTFGSIYYEDINSLNQVKEWYEEGLIQEFSISMNTPMPGTPFYKICEDNQWLLLDSNAYDGSYKAMVNFPNYAAEDIYRAFEYGISIRDYILNSNKEKGIKYSMYDKEWCKEVYNTSNRNIGEGII